jgi:hypothetical protein
MYYILASDKENVDITFDSFAKAQRAYYLQWRLADGSIPWKIIHAQYELDPVTGNIAFSRR